MLHVRVVILTLALLGVSGALSGARGQSAAAASPPLRALRVPAAMIRTSAAVPEVVDEARRLGFTALFVQVRDLGEAYYRSSLEPRATPLHLEPGYDPLAAMVTAAHDAGLQIHAWLPLTEAADSTSLPGARGHVLYTHPEWLMVPRAIAAELRRLDPRSPEYLGRLTRWIRATPGTPTRLYLSPGSADASAHLAAVAREIVSRYELDGLHLDAVGLPGPDLDYGVASTEAFRRDSQRALTTADRVRLEEEHAVSPLAYPQHAPEAWDSFRRARVTGLLMRIRSAVRGVRTSVRISAAVRGLPDVSFEDPRSWSELSVVDSVALPRRDAGGSDVPRADQALPGSAAVWRLARLDHMPADTLREWLQREPSTDEGIVLDDAAALVGEDAATLQRQQMIRDAFRGPGGR